jgi:acyl-coenzyme A synthetase/AMP-(fatty) acid ligase
MAIWKLKTVQRPYKSGGEWISSVALESALMAHPKIKEAAIAIADENG